MAHPHHSPLRRAGHPSRRPRPSVHLGSGIALAALTHVCVALALSPTFARLNAPLPEQAPTTSSPEDDAPSVQVVLDAPPEPEPEPEAEPPLAELQPPPPEPKPAPEPKPKPPPKPKPKPKPEKKPEEKPKEKPPPPKQLKLDKHKIVHQKVDRATPPPERTDRLAEQDRRVDREEMPTAQSLDSESMTADPTKRAKVAKSAPRPAPPKPPDAVASEGGAPTPKGDPSAKLQAAPPKAAARPSPPPKPKPDPAPKPTPAPEPPAQPPRAEAAPKKLPTPARPTPLLPQPPAPSSATPPEDASAAPAAQPPQPSQPPQPVAEAAPPAPPSPKPPAPPAPSDTSAPSDAPSDASSETPAFDAQQAFTLKPESYQEVFGERDAVDIQRYENRPGRFLGNWRQRAEQMRAAMMNFGIRVQPGRQLKINARSSVYAAYIGSIHKRIHARWAFSYLKHLDLHFPMSHPLSNSNLHTAIEFVIDARSGLIKECNIAQSSGNLEYDMAAVRTCHDAAPAPAAPAPIVSPDGNVYLHWNFWRNVRQCGTFGVSIFVIDKAGRLNTYDVTREVDDLRTAPAPVSPRAPRRGDDDDHGHGHGHGHGGPDPDSPARGPVPGPAPDPAPEPKLPTPLLPPPEPPAGLPDIPAPGTP